MPVQMPFQIDPHSNVDQETGDTLVDPQHSEASEPLGTPGGESPLAEDFSFRAVYENTPVMMHSLGADQQFVSVNRYWLAVLGYQEDEVIGRNASDFLTEESLRYVVEVARPQLRETGTVRDVPYQMVKKNGEVIDVFLSAVVVRDASGQFVRSYSYLFDANDRRTSDDLWRQLSLVGERNRISRDLHNTVEHSLIRIMLRTGIVRELMDSDPMAAQEDLESIHALGKLGLEQLRRAVWDLQPLAISSTLIKDVISRGLSTLGDNAVRTSLVVDGEEPRGIDLRNKMAAIRILEEVFSNIRLHSQAKMANVRLSYSDSHLSIMISEDGVGFEPSTVHSARFPGSRGIGLANMRESAQMAGGSVHVRSALGEGTQVEVKIPFKHNPEQEPSSAVQLMDQKPPGLTIRELEVLSILANGGRNKDIAAQMFVSLRTVKFHIENLYKKLNVRTRAELIRVATQRGILTV